MRSSNILAAILLVAVTPRLLQAEARVESNVVYGMYSGLALLMDVHYPANPNGYGVVFIVGSNWSAPLSLDAEPLKNGANRGFQAANELLEGGYTLFSINHRAAPRFRYPAAVEDAQRAVRYVRHHAARYEIDPDRIGAIGGSSGGHLALMLGVLDEDANPRASSSVDQESFKVQTVVAWFPLTNFIDYESSQFLGFGFSRSQIENYPNSPEAILVREASPTSYVSSDDPPVLLVHGDQDNVVSYSHSEIFKTLLDASGVQADLIIVLGGGHAGNLAVPNAPDYIGATVEWFDRHLRGDRQ